ncbi:MAG: D-alanyl-D-alanine carboxypeptidase [Lachnospiraceae bacterium]|nr:D-alanyl-D-alanine carboxypeptidase [Lachnospiraceae bacterium]
MRERMKLFTAKVTALLLARVLACSGAMQVQAATVLTKENFDYERYANDYPDLKAAFGTDREKLWQHYIRNGAREKRVVYVVGGDRGILDPNTALTKENFDFQRYANTYPDVQAAYGLNPDKLWNHYQTFGIKENRKAYVIGAGGDDEVVQAPQPSTYAVVVDVRAANAVMERNANASMNPASMTKILTLLVAVEHISDLNAPVTVPQGVIDYAKAELASRVGFSAGETVRVQDLLYGTILPSGADAALTLAIYVGGSHENFVRMMNEKLAQLGLSKTAHVTNCIGLYDANHHCTVKDVAVLLGEAMKNPLCAQILGARTYTTTGTAQHPGGITVRNNFLVQIDPMETNGNIRAAKTGYLRQAGSCAASYLVSKSGRHYICVTGNAGNSAQAIRDHALLYQQYAK